MTVRKTVSEASLTHVDGRVPRWRTWLRGLLGVALGAGAIWLVFRAAGGLGDVGTALRRTNPWWLLPAVAFEALSYVLAGVRLRRLADEEADLTVVSATGIELVVNGLGLLTPASPAEGLAFATAELSRRGLPRRRIGLSLGFASWFSFRIFYLAGAVNLLFMVATRDLPVDATWPLVVAPLVLALLAVTAVLANRSGPPNTAVELGALRFWKPRPSCANAGPQVPGSMPTRWPSSARRAGGFAWRCSRSARR